MFEKWSLMIVVFYKFVLMRYFYFYIKIVYLKVKLLSLFIDCWFRGWNFLIKRRFDIGEDRG